MHSKADHYAAKTIHAIYASQGVKGMSPSDYLITYERPKRKVAPTEDAWKFNRSLWLGMVGLDPDEAELE